MRIIKSYNKYITESLSRPSIEQYIIDNDIKCDGKYPNFLYHGTSVEPSKFHLDPDLDWEDIDNGNVWDIEMPSGYIFLTNDIREASSYGKYVIPFELNTENILTIKVYSESPSREFDDDYNYGSEFKIWDNFMDSGYPILEVSGFHKSTFVVPIDYDIINPRLDIAKEFYNI